MRAMIFCLVLVIAGCSREARLYPANPQASETGLLHAKFVDSGMGAGPIEITMSNGEVLKGEFTTHDTSSYGFGAMIAAVGGAAGVATGSSFSMTGSQPGTAALIGANGTTMRCEYVVNVLTSSGSGACQTSKGAMYRLHF